MLVDDVEEKLEEHGEVIIRMDSDKEYELHLGNTEIEDDRIYIDAITREYYLDASKIESYYVHYEI